MNVKMNNEIPVRNFGISNFFIKGIDIDIVGASRLVSKEQF